MCTIFAKRERKGIIIGRSFDWVQYGGNVCFVPSYRRYGLNTIGFSAIEQLGEDRPYEGMNEEGLFVGVTAIPNKKDEKEPKGPLMIESLGMVRFILETAKNVDEALYIVKNFNIDYRIRYGVPKVQYFFVDVNNKVGIYEEGGFEESVVLNEGEYRILTNKSVNSKVECKRYDKINSILKENVIVDDKMCMDMISTVKQDKLTAWSSVYNLKNRRFSVCIEQNFEKKYDFYLNYCLKKGRFSVDFAELKLNSKVMRRKNHNGFYDLDGLF